MENACMTGQKYKSTLAKCLRSQHRQSLAAVDLTAANDNVWHRGLTCKLFRLLPHKHIISMIMELVRNQSYTLTTSTGKQSRLQRRKNGIRMAQSCPI